MVRATLKSFLIICLVSTITLPSAFAQYGSADGTQRTGAGPRKQLATIIFAGLGGAALGLSTLSFYGRPQDKLSNIAIGFAVGVIGGTTYVTYKAATDPAGFYGQEFRPLLEREAEVAQMRFAPMGRPPALGLTFDF